jgi:hypothetical protein
MVGVLMFQYVPNLRQNLMSVTAMMDIGITVDLFPEGHLHGSGYYGEVMKKTNGTLFTTLTVRVPFRERGPRGPEGGYPIMPTPGGRDAAHQCTRATTMSPPPDPSVRFLVDSGATHTIVNSLRGVVLDDGLASVQVMLADGTRLMSSGRGVFNGVHEVIYMPGFSHNLVSVAAMAKEGYVVKTYNGGGKYFVPNKSIYLPLAEVHRAGSLFYTDLQFLGLDVGLPEGKADLTTVPIRFCASVQVTHVLAPATNRLKCTFCGGSNHVVETCWDIHPKRRVDHLARSLKANAALLPRRASALPAVQKSDAAYPDLPLFRMAIGTLQWLSRMLYPEIEYSVAQCAKKEQPTGADVEEVITLLRHCQCGWSIPKGMGLRLSAVELEAQAIRAVGRQVLELLDHVGGATVGATILVDHHGAADSFEEV